MRFILKNKVYEISKDDVIEKMRGVQPEVFRKYYIQINNMQYPPKQIIARVLELGRVEFTTMDAINILKRLGFELEGNKS
jgi:hypothetical protein